ncbi:MAG TPA: WbqC family protein [Candidatus Nitrosotalea sp.]|nr:WbqC family protein [Candidatus Nitrosotalea sp.]
MIVSINQPAYLPWLGYFHRIAVSDAHIVLDHVQFEKNSFTNRNKIRTADGWCWLTVPVKTAGKFGDLSIHEIAVANEKKWAQKHWQTLRINYGKARFFAQHEAFFEGVYSRSWPRLDDLMREITEYLLDAFGIRTKLYFSSQMKVSGKKDELVLNLCRELKATQYLSGPLGRDYLREEMFGSHGIAVRYDDYHHPAYSQAYPGFEPYMAAIDLLFNAGPASLDIILKGQERIAE